MLIQWGHHGSDGYCTLPTSYTTIYTVHAQNKSAMGYCRIDITSLSTFVNLGSVGTTWMWMSIGY